LKVSLIFIFVGVCSGAPPEMSVLKELTSSLLSQR